MKLKKTIHLKLLILVFAYVNLKSLSYNFEPEVCIFGSKEFSENILREPLSKQIQDFNLNIKLFDDNSSLILNCSEINNSIFLSGGNVSLFNVQRITDFGRIVGPGTITLFNKSIALFNTSFSSNINFLGSGEFVQEKNFVLSGCNLSFYDSNKIVWSGNNKSLEILSDAYFTIGENSSITFSDMILKIDNLKSFIILNPKNIWLNQIILQVGEDVFAVEHQTLFSFLQSDEYINKNLNREINLKKITSNFQLLDSIVLNPDNKIIFEGYEKEFLFDGSDLNIEFSRDKESLIILPNNCLVKFINCQFINFNVKNILLGTGATIIFGDNTSIFLIDDLEIDFSSKYKFSENVNIFGNGNMINLTSSSALSLESGSSLNIENTQLYINNPDAIKQEKTSILSLNNCDLLIGSKDIIFSNGLLKTEGLVQVFNKLEDNKLIASLIFSNESSLTISSGSCLTFNLETCLSFNKSTSSHLVTMDNSDSWLFLNSAAIDLSGKNLTLNSGSIIIDEKSRIYSSKNQSSLSVSDNCCIKILNKATCILDNVSIINL